MFATKSQVDTAIRNAIRMGDALPTNVGALRAKLSALTSADVHQFIREQNARSGWTSDAPASQAQRRYLAVLEKAVHGAVQTMPFEQLSSRDASKLIAYLKDVKAAIDAKMAAGSNFDYDAILGLSSTEGADHV